ncbi:nitroreductase family protein [Janibacter hoylei]|uniref:nitroreductase family protein n=1 Tax=Janibacter hoylei TaxID=364298 RepID=UPI00249319AF|nr:nitroreductase family protein [Janibacter hoylei]
MTFRTTVNRGRDRLLIAFEAARDAGRYMRYAGLSDRGVTGRPQGHNLEAQLTKDYHRVEKGLTLRDPKRPFGDAVKGRLETFGEVAREAQREDLVGADGHVTTALAALHQWNSGGGVSDDIAPAGRTIEPLAVEDARRLFMERHSLRNFDADRTVDRETLEEALRFTSHTPSVCNRQSGRIHLVNDRDRVQAVLQVQAGSAGFRETIPHVAVVTAETGLFTGAGERNQVWIDGGLMAMTFVWALQSLGVHTCMLNWSKRNHLSDRLREIVEIPGSESIICVVAFGYPPVEGHRVARSPRRALADYTTGIESF